MSDLFNMPIHFWGDMLTMIGDIVIALTVLAVIEKLRKEKVIDKEVLEIMRLEKYAGILGISMVVTGQLLRILSDVYS